MKKLYVSAWFKVRQQALAKRKQRRKARASSSKARRFRQEHALEDVVLNQGREGKKTAFARGKRSMPSILCFDQNHEETLDFLTEMRATVLAGAVASKRKLGKKSSLDFAPSRIKRRISSYFEFADLKFISPTAALIVAALYDRNRFISGIPSTTINEHRWDPAVVDTLQSVGFYDLLDIASAERKVTPNPDVRTLRFVSGDVANPEAAGQLQEALAELLPEEVRDRLFFTEPYGGMLEAIQNSHMWAYPDDACWDYPPMKRWWMTGSVDFRTSAVTVAVYDQGVSIPASLPRWRNWEKLLHAVSRVPGLSDLGPIGSDPRVDGNAIAMAMDIAESSTKLAHHGKGLHTMVEVAQRATWAQLRVLSRNGEYIWETERLPRHSSLRQSIGGTLIEWKLRP